METNKTNTLKLIEYLNSLADDFSLQAILKRLAYGNVTEFIDDWEHFVLEYLDFFATKSALVRPIKVIPLAFSALNVYNKHFELICETVEKADKNWDIFESSIVTDEKDNPNLVWKLGQQIAEVSFAFLLDAIVNDTGKHPANLYADLSTALTTLVKDCAKDLESKEK